MLDIDFVRKYPDLVLQNLKKRKDKDKFALLDAVLDNDMKWRELKQKVDDLRARRNKVSQEINKAKKEGRDAKKLLKEAKDIPRKIENLESEMGVLKGNLRTALLRIPNMLHESVPYGKDDADNVIVEKCNERPSFKFKPRSHVDVIEDFDLVDLERAAKISGSRWYFLKNELVLLDLALQRYAVDFMRKKGFTPIVPPYMVDRRTVETATSLDDFEEAIYSVKEEPLYMIPTSEHPLVAMWCDEVIDAKCLPIRLVGLSTNFRKEAGAHGKDQKGIFRVHQFNKVEQVVICKESESWQFHERLLRNAKEFLDSLGLHYQVVNVCTGDLGIVAAKKYDIEGWFPVQDAYRELVSCSNCTSYQAVRGNIRYDDGKERRHAHTLNSTVVATSRVMVAILENFQCEDGSVDIPKVLHKYTGFKKIKR